MEKLLELLGSGTVKSAFDFVRSLITTKADKMNWLSEINNLINQDNIKDAELKNKLVDLYKLIEEHKFDDTISAREMNTQINVSQNSSWLSKNINPLIAIVFISSYVLLNLSLMYYPSKETEMLKLKVLDSVQSIMLLIIGFYFGSSQGGKDMRERMLGIIETDKSKTYKDTTNRI
jgi:hypothetical protein